MNEKITNGLFANPAQSSVPAAGKDAPKWHSPSSIYRIISKHKAFIFPFIFIYLWLIVYTAWVSDDGFITFRSIENWIHGYGPVFNIGERVQTFTHPLWFFLQSLIYLLTRPFDAPFGLNKLFYGNVLLSLSLSIITIALFVFKVARSPQIAIAGSLVLILSKAYLDYSTSGLENPLSHLLALCFFGLFLFQEKDDSQNITLLAFLACLSALNRLDTILIFFPPLLLVIWQSLNRLDAIRSMVIGFLPLVLWELFSLFYYGTPFPNTASAKLNNGIQTTTLLRQGAYYFLNSLRMDTITLTVIACAITFSFFSRNLRRISVAVGTGLYLAYILYIGGDFMSGRYFSLPLLVAVILLSTFELKSFIAFTGASVVIVTVGLLPFFTMIERRPTYGQNREDNRAFFDAHRIADERLVYKDRTGLLIALQGDSPKVIYAQDEWEYITGYPREVHLVGAMGLNSYRDGPNVHVIDRNGLADPLIARMPLEDTQDFRIGHFHHIIPVGYEGTLATGTNQIQDADVALFYDKLSMVVKGTLWDWDRIIEIWGLNTGKYNYLIENIE
jgi:arabinofuranosyltransferase